MLALRELERGDLSELNVWRRDPALIRQLGAPYRFINREVDERWFDEYLRQRGSTIRCALIEQEQPETILGLVALRDIDWISRSGEAHIMIGRPEQRGRGRGAFALSAMLRHAFQDMNLNRVELRVLPDNAPAIGLYRKLGFQNEGRLRQAVCKEGTYMDLLIMSLLREEWNRCEH